MFVQLKMKRWETTGEESWIVAGQGVELDKRGK